MGQPEVTPAAGPAAAGTPLRSRRDDLLWVLGFLGGAIASRVLDVRGPRDDLALGRRRLPPMCVLLLMTGRRCPSCGMTRGFLYMFRLDVLNAVRANLMSPAVFAAATLRAARAAAALVTRAGAAPAP